MSLFQQSFLSWLTAAAMLMTAGVPGTPARSASPLLAAEWGGHLKARSETCTSKVCIKACAIAISSEVGTFTAGTDKKHIQACTG